MANQYSGNSKLCATCVHWMGQRDINGSGSWVTNCADSGRCTANRCVIKTTIANQCACFDWKKWPVLK